MVDTYMSSNGDDVVPAADRVLKSGVNMNVDSSAGSEVKRLHIGGGLPIETWSQPLHSPIHTDQRLGLGAAELPRRLEVVAT